VPSAAPAKLPHLPTISRFYGIVIAMYYGDHPPPHFHARHGGQKARIAIASGEPIEGHLPPGALRLLRKWSDAHRDELDANWRRAEAEAPLEPVAPLP
jgi:hypothetical protein